MPSRTTTQNRVHKRWVPPYWVGPTTTEPTEVATLHQSWTDDLVQSGGNHGWESRRGFRGEGSDRGGDFLVFRRFYDENILANGADVHFSWDPDPTVESNVYTLANQWPWRDEFNSSHFPVEQPSSNDTLHALGTTAIARCAPTKPKADLSTFLGELREGLPHAIGLSATGEARARKARNAGDEYLNVEFGWKPLIRDVRAFANAYKRSSELLKAYHNGAGVLIKRRYRFPTDLTIEEESLGTRYPLPHLHSWIYTHVGPQELTVERSRKVERWFSASFVYDVPRSGDPFRYVNDVDYLLGVKLTPEVLWNLAPWSWAADWVANTGDLMSNLSSFATDSLVMHHAYMMEKITNVYTYRMNVPENFWRSHKAARQLSQTFTGVTKRRVGATPYGFGLNWDGFTPKQMGILASLGISRTK